MAFSPYLTPRTFAILVAAIALLGLGDASRAAARADSKAPLGAASTPLQDAPCGEGFLSDDGVCVQIESNSYDEGEAVNAVSNAHRDRSGSWKTYDQIPRHPERPADYDRYRYPVPPGIAGNHSVISGYDLDRPDGEQRRSSHLKHVGHGAVDLPQKRGTPVNLVALEHQEGDAILLFEGELFGTTVITKHSVREAGGLRDYVILYGHLDRIQSGMQLSQGLPEGSTIGFVGDTGSPDLVHLHLEVRRVREGVSIENEVRKLSGGAILMDHVAVVCDPRNVLPLR